MKRVVAAAGAIGSIALFALGAAPAHAVSMMKTVDVDLATQIDAAETKPDRFAVDVPHEASLTTAGSWERAAGISTWRYAARIPGAVSMSFHAGTFELPRGATLLVRGADGAQASYSAGDGARGELWSRILRGDTLSFVLAVPTVDEPAASFAIASLQAGYRGLGGGVANHAHYQKLHREAVSANAGASASASAAACTQNFACRATTENSVNGDATAAIVIGNVALCTGTLVNNLRNDGAPYLLTARHCQDSPSSGLVVYWDAVTPCGGALGSVYDSRQLAWAHTTDTVFEQQDVWMVRLSGPIDAQRTYFAGWDVTGGAFIGGYSPHHALGRNRQYTGWFGQAVLRNLPGGVLGVGYDSIYWGVVNDVGNVGPGASGGGLFDANHRLVGVASRARLEDASGEGVCPAGSPSAPSASNSTALYSALSAVWDTNADPTSFTNPVTLKSLLDPDNSGARVGNGYEPLPGVSISANQTTLATGEEATLTWVGGAATSCVASGGAAGDGWAGARSASGTRVVTQYSGGDTTYLIRCSQGARSAVRSVRIHWNENPPSLFAAPSTDVDYLGARVDISWKTNVPPCVASGGSAGDGWAGAKSPTGLQGVPLLRAGVVSYTLTCGAGARQSTSTFDVTVQAPVATLEAVSNNMRVGSEVLVLQAAGGTSCARTGGRTGDGWRTSTGPIFRVTSGTAGTFHYVLTCNGGPTPAVATLDLTWMNAAPQATLTPSKTSAEVVSPGPVADIGEDPPYAIRFAWTSNVAPCQLSYDGPGNQDGVVTPSMDHPAVGSALSHQSVPGSYVYRVTCTNAGVTSSATTTVQFVPEAPRLDFILNNLTIDGLYVAAGEPLNFGWTSTVAGCVASGGAAGDGWAGSKSQSGNASITLSAPGTYAYSLTCGTAPNVVSRSIGVTIDPPHVEFRPHAATSLVQHGIPLGWISTVGPCTLTGAWSAPGSTFPAHGANVAVSSTAGARNYGVRCGPAGAQVEATTQVTYLPPPMVDITASVSAAAVNQPVTLTWTSQNAARCEVQGTGTQDWNGDLPLNGSRVVTRGAAGSVGFYIACDDTIDAVVVEWRDQLPSPPRAQGPTLTFSIDQSERRSGEPVTLTWSTTRAAMCTGSLGVAGDGWAGVLPVSGTRSFTISGTGTFEWQLSCDGALPSATARVSATYAAAPAAPPPSSSSGGGGSSSSGGGGGGGRFDPLLLLGLAALVIALASRPRRAPQGAGARGAGI